jgi:hypothetical protein
MRRWAASMIFSLEERRGRKDGTAKKEKKEKKLNCFPFFFALSLFFRCDDDKAIGSKESKTSFFLFVIRSRSLSFCRFSTP